MAASTVRLACCICPETFSSNNDLKNHLIASPNSCMRVICSWCIREETTYRRMTELKYHIEIRHSSLLKILTSDFFRESNGFWLAMQPENYRKDIRPNAWDSAVAIITRAAVLGWLGAVKKSSKGQQEWESGWDAMLGRTSRPSQQSSPKIRPDTSLSESRCIPDYEEEIEEPEYRKRRCESDSPTRPEIQTELEVHSFQMTGERKTIQIVSTNGTLWYRCEVKKAETNARLLDTLLWRVSARSHTSPTTPSSKMTTLEEADREFTLKLAKVIGVNKDSITCISKTSVFFTPPRVVEVEETPCRVPAMPKPQELSTPVAAMCILPETPRLAEDAPSILYLSIRSSSLPHMSSAACNNPKRCPDTKERILVIQEKGFIPLSSPARRDCKKEMNFTFMEGSTVIYWPSEVWTNMTPEKKLLSWEYIAMILETGMNPALERSCLMDKYNILALPGTPEPAYGGEMVPRRARYYSYEWLRQLAIHRSRTTAEKESLAMIE